MSILELCLEILQGQKGDFAVLNSLPIEYDFIFNNLYFLTCFNFYIFTL